NIPMICPMAGSTLMTKTFESFPTKSAHPLLAGKIPRICTGTTSFFISTVYGLNLKKQVSTQPHWGSSNFRVQGLKLILKGWWDGGRVAYCVFRSFFRAPPISFTQHATRSQ